MILSLLGNCRLKMEKTLIFLTLLVICSANFKIDVPELRCLVCKVSLTELMEVVKQVDPDKKVDIGGYRLDEQGNLIKKTVPQAKSETHLSELIDDICNKLDDYVRGTWKTNGTLVVLKLIMDNGKMNPDLNLVDIIQDDDLNRSLKYYCEGIMEEFEESIIGHIQKDTGDIHRTVCHDETRLCSDPDKNPNDEL